MYYKHKNQLLLLRKEIKAWLTGILPNKDKHSPNRLPEAPGSDTPQEGIAILTIVKDEAPYLAEWLEFHFMLGVKHVYIYDNGSTDNTPDILAPYIRDKIVTVIPWKNFSTILNPQITAYGHGIANFGWNYRWVAAIDVDEFIFPAEGSSLEYTLNEFQDQPAVSMPWMNFGPSGHQKKPLGLVIENYTERAAFPLKPQQYSLLRYKSIYNPREIVTPSSHVSTIKKIGKSFINDRGQTVKYHRSRDMRYATADKLRLHHYFTRSHEEIERKLAKGRVSQKGRVNLTAIDRRLRQYELATEQDESILRFVPELKSQLAKRNIQPVTRKRSEEIRKIA